MAMLEGKLTPEDIELLIESMGYWETAGNRDFHIMNMVKNAVVPDEDDESFEFVKQVKDHFASREREIKADRSLRQEKATMLKAKLMLMRQELGVDRLFEEAAEPAAETPAPKPKKKPVPVKDKEDGPKPVIVKTEKSDETPDDPEKLAKAEAFLDQSGITSYYQKFLGDSESTLAKAEQYIQECGMEEHYKEFLAS